MHNIDRINNFNNDREEGGDGYTQVDTINGIMDENNILFNNLPPIHTLVDADMPCAAEFFFEALCCATRKAALKQQSAIYKYETAWLKAKDGEIFTLKQDYLNMINQLEIFQKERELSDFLDRKLKKELANYQKFECLNSEKITPYFMNLIKTKAKEASLDDIVDDTSKEFVDNAAREEFICTSFETLYKKPNNLKLEPNSVDNFLGSTAQHPIVARAKLSQCEKDMLDKNLTIEELDESIKNAKTKSTPGADGFSNKFILPF